MNEDDFDRAARAWLEDGPSRMSDRALLSSLEEIHRARQRRAVSPAWRTFHMSLFARVGVAAVLVAGVGLLAVIVVPRLGSGPSLGASPAPVATSTPSPSLSPSSTSPDTVDLPKLTVTFVSPANGYSAKFIDRGPVTPAAERWIPPQPLGDGSGPIGATASFFDWMETGYGAAFFGTSTAIPQGVSIDDWIDRSVAGLAPNATCMQPRSLQAEITIDGQPARISEGCTGQFVATVVAGGRLYVFVLLHGGDREAWARAFFDSWLATIRLTPETVASLPSALPSR